MIKISRNKLVYKIQNKPPKEKILSFKDEVSLIKGSKRNFHNIHSYPAKLIPHIPYYFLNNKQYIPKNGIVGDFFCGSGTVLVEASLAGHESIGMDINPLSVLISKVKTTPLQHKSLESDFLLIRRKIKTLKTPTIPDFPYRDYWFSDSTSKKLGLIKHALDSVKLTRNNNNFFKLCFSSIIRNCSNADPRISPPVFSKRMKILYQEGRKIDPVKLFEESMIRNSYRLQFLSNFTKLKKSKVIQGDSTKINNLRNHLDVVITSPPYIDAQKYMRSSKLELYWLGLTNPKSFIKYDKNSIGTEKNNYTIDYDLDGKNLKSVYDLIDFINSRNPRRAYVLKKYLVQIENVLLSIRKSLKSSGKLVLVIGNNKMAGTRIPLDACINDISSELGFHLIEKFVDPIRSRGYMTKRNKKQLMDSERVLVFEKS